MKSIVLLALETVVNVLGPLYVLANGDSRTRGSNGLYQPVAQKDVYKFFFFPRTIMEWNLLPASVADADKLEFRGRSQNLPEPLYAH
jgi:hypothetical protein